MLDKHMPLQKVQVKETLYEISIIKRHAKKVILKNKKVSYIILYGIIRSLLLLLYITITWNIHIDLFFKIFWNSIGYSSEYNWIEVGGPPLWHVIT
jgi:hypothetical protein